MARTLHKLSDSIARSDKLRAGRHSDGGGLYLLVGPSGNKSWVFMWAREGKRTEMGLGAYPSLTLAKARARSAECREALSDGLDPLALRNKERPRTFGECADDFLASMSSGWRNDKHGKQWAMTLGDAYCRSIRSKPVADVMTADILGILSPIWQTKAETASRIRGRIERVLEYARVKGWRTGENPALWRGHLRGALPMRQKLQRGHHAAMPYPQVPAFVATVAASAGMSARALEFLILTAARTGEVLGAKWDEFDFEQKVWTVPAARMKAGHVHRVPLSDRCIEILRVLYEVRTCDYVFAGERRDRPLSSMALAMTLRRSKAGEFTVHGFRSAFRDWCGDETPFAREVAEAALAHTIGNKVEAAYRRSDALTKRRQLMQAWEAFCLATDYNNVVALRPKESVNSAA